MLFASAALTKHRLSFFLSAWTEGVPKGHGIHRWPNGDQVHFVTNSIVFASSFFVYTNTKNQTCEDKNEKLPPPFHSMSPENGMVGKSKVGNTVGMVILSPLLGVLKTSSWKVTLKKIMEYSAASIQIQRPLMQVK